MGSSDSKYIINLIASAQKGNKNSFLQLVELNLGNIYLLSLRLLNDQKLASEITKEIFIHTWQNLKQIRSDTSFSSWLHGIAIYKNLELIKKRKSDKSGRGSLESSKPTYINKKLEYHLSELDEEERITFVLHDIVGYSYGEISDLLSDYTKESIIEFIHSARKKLAKEFENDL